MNLLRPILIAAAGGFMLFFIIGALATFVVSAQEPEKIQDGDDWQPAVLPEIRDPSALYQQLTSHRLMSEQVVNENEVRSESALSALPIQIPGVGALLGLLFQGDEQLALIQGLDGGSIVAFRPGDLLPSGARIVAVRYNAIELQVENGPVSTIKLYPEPETDHSSAQ